MIDKSLQQFALRLPTEMHVQLKAQAAQNRRSMNSEIILLLESKLMQAQDGTPVEQGA